MKCPCARRPPITDTSNGPISVHIRHTRVCLMWPECRRPAWVDANKKRQPRPLQAPPPRDRQMNQVECGRNAVWGGFEECLINSHFQSVILSQSDTVAAISGSRLKTRQTKPPTSSNAAAGHFNAAPHSTRVPRRRSNARNCAGVQQPGRPAADAGSRDGGGGAG